jgi:phosphohistidine phosphatase SixA
MVIRTAAPIAAFLLSAAIVSAQALPDAELIAALQHGGNVIVLRHASSPNALPAPGAANRDNVKAERQLDARGRADAEAIGNALRTLRISIGEVLSSPTYRALETIRRAGLSTPRPTPELGDNGQSMQGSSQDQTQWLQQRVRDLPTNTNTLLVTHAPNITRAFPALGPVSEGEAIVFGADARVIGRIPAERWRQLMR